MAHSLFVVSDATGETGERVLKAAMMQFPAVDVTIERFGGIRDHQQMLEVMPCQLTNLKRPSVTMKMTDCFALPAGRTFFLV